VVGEGVGIRTPGSLVAAQQEQKLCISALHHLQVSVLVQMEIGTLSASGNYVEQLLAHSGHLNNGAFLRSVPLLTHL